MALFNKLPKPDPTQTQLAYKLRYWPYSMLGQAARKLLVFGRCTSTYPTVFTKAQILDKIIDDADKRFLLHEGVKYEIHWLFNCIPTEEEWNKKSDSYLIRVEFRFHRHWGELPKAILSFGNWREMQARVADCQSENL